MRLQLRIALSMAGVLKRVFLRLLLSLAACLMLRCCFKQRCLWPVHSKAPLMVQKASHQQTHAFHQAT